MIKSYFILLICFACSYTTTAQRYYSGVFPEEQLDFIKSNYAWNEEEFLIINYKYPISTCHYNQYRNPDNAKAWWEDYYENLKLGDQVHNIFVYAEKDKMAYIIDKKKYFPDYADFLLDKLFSVKEACYGLLIVDKEGDYYQKIGEYSKDDVSFFINLLRRN